MSLAASGWPKVRVGGHALLGSRRTLSCGFWWFNLRHLAGAATQIHIQALTNLIGLIGCMREANGRAPKSLLTEKQGQHTDRLLVVRLAIVCFALLRSTMILSATRYTQRKRKGEEFACEIQWCN